MLGMSLFIGSWNKILWCHFPLYSKKLQNRVIRIITDSPYDAPAKPLLRQLRLHISSDEQNAS